MDVPFTQAYLGRAVTRGELWGLARVHGRNAESVLADELFLADPGHVFMGVHAFAHRDVVNGDVLEPLVTHALGDQRLNLLDVLDELS